MRVLIAGECFSPNLGDPLLCRSVAELIRGARRDAEIEMLDISGRPPLGEGTRAETNRSRRALMRVLPPRLLAEGAWLKNRRGVRRAFRAAVAGVDAVVVPGGQLFMDNWLQFPRRLAVLFGEAERRGVPVAVWACGMYGALSGRAHGLLSRVIGSQALVYLGVRDSGSARNVAARFGATAVLNPDPALAWLSGRQLTQPRPAAPGPVAVAVMDPAAAARHRPNPPAEVDLVFRALLARCPAGSMVFGNGEVGDWEYQLHLQRSLPAAVSARLEWTARLRDPDHLVATIGRADEVYCARLHAAIPGWALGRRTWMLRGDSKSEAIMHDLGLPQDPSDGVLGRQPAFRGGAWSGQGAAVARAQEGIGVMLRRLDGHLAGRGERPR